MGLSMQKPRIPLALASRGGPRRTCRLPINAFIPGPPRLGPEARA